MSDISKTSDTIKDWQDKIEIANRNNIFCHCHCCGAEWIDSQIDVICKCGSSQVEKICCWQFPDD